MENIENLKTENLETEKKEYKELKLLLTIIENTLNRNLETETYNYLIIVIKELIKELKKENKFNELKEIEKKINNDNEYFLSYYNYCIKNDNTLNLEYFMTL